MRLFVRVLTASLLFLHVTAGAAEGRRQIMISQTVGQYGSKVLTSRGVALAVLMESLIDEVRGKAQLIEPGKVPDKAAIGKVLLESAISLEADSFSLGSVNADAESWVNKTQKWLAQHPEANAYEFTKSEIELRANEKARARAFIRLKTESLKGLVTESEAATYFEQNRVKFGQLPFSAFRENIMNFLAQQRGEERMRSWFDIIKRKYQVREFGDASAI